jgi:hypothetical protein
LLPSSGLPEKKKIERNNIKTENNKIPAARAEGKHGRVFFLFQFFSAYHPWVTKTPSAPFEKINPTQAVRGGAK